VDVDEVDRQIVRTLQRDGRTSYSALADAVGLARTSTRARVLRLLDSGKVRIITVVHPAVFGLEAFAHARIDVGEPVRRTAEELATFGEIRYLAMTAARFAVSAELLCVDMNELAQAMDRVRAINGVRGARMVSYLRIWKDPYLPPAPLQKIELDDADRTLLARLHVNGRAPFAQLADEAGLSQGAARSRVLRMLEAGVVHVSAQVRSDTVGHGHLYGFGLVLDGEADAVARRLVEFDHVRFLATGIGWCDIVGSLHGESFEEIIDTLEYIRATPGVHTVEVWSEVHVFKETYHETLLQTAVRDAADEAP